MGAEGIKLGYVLMENKGNQGTFNRAQRALQTYNEQLPTTIVQYIAASWVWPFESFICIMVWALSSWASAVGYTNSADGRMVGKIPGLFAITTPQGLLLIAAYKALS